MSRVAFALVALFGFSLALVAAQSAAPSGAARLLVAKQLDHHTLMPHNFALDAPINVTLSIFNAGDVPARDIKLEDSWLAGFELSGPVGPWTWEEIAPGASVNVSYFVTPTQQGGFDSTPARVTYTPAEGAAPQIGYSSSATNLNVISSEVFSKLTSTRTLEWGIFGGVLALFVLAPLARYYELSSSYSKGGHRKGQ